MKEKICDVCEKPLKEVVPIQTKAHGLLDVCPRCADWIRAHRYAA